MSDRGALTREKRISKAGSQTSARIFTYLVCLSFLLLSCSGTPSEVRPAFYHWKSRFAPSAMELAYLDSLEVGRLYLRFFDLDWDEGRREIVPVGKLRIDAQPPVGMEIIPTLFITNRSILELEPNSVSSLASQILELTDRIARQVPAHTWREMQIDCDWSGQSRDRYFQLLEAIGKELAKSGKRLSVTLRLHQYRYPRTTGV
ncbi:MAG: hypothetical protein R3350_05300, partial [Saprospiraceae bacterium]|nr:hypothetical protein [Saprospiraceae bacterium]